MGEDPASVPTEDPALLKTRLLAHEDLFRRRVALTVDGSAARPDIGWEVAPPVASGAPPLATITLAVDAGRSAGEMTWMYGWTFTSYAFVTAFGPTTPRRPRSGSREVTSPRPCRCSRSRPRNPVSA